MKWMCISCDTPISQYEEYCPACEEKRYKKIGGFLFIPLLNLLYIGFSYFLGVANIVKVITGYYDMMINFHKWYFSLSLLINCVLFLMSIYVISLFFRKKKSLPKLFIVLLISMVITLCVDQIVAAHIFDAYKMSFEQIMPIIRAAGFTVIWSFYFLKSVRVKKTFIYK